MMQLVLASLFNKHIFLVGRYFLQTDPQFCMKVAETACWDLEDELKIFGLEKANNGSISILFLLVISLYGYNQILLIFV